MARLHYGNRAKGDRPSTRPSVPCLREAGVLETQDMLSIKGVRCRDVNRKGHLMPAGLRSDKLSAVHVSVASHQSILPVEKGNLMVKLHPNEL
jgi:hypothetical protein